MKISETEIRSAGDSRQGKRQDGTGVTDSLTARTGRVVIDGVNLVTRHMKAATGSEAVRAGSNS